MKFKFVECCYLPRITWIGWREEFTSFISSFVFVAVYCEGAETVLAIRLSISDSYLSESLWGRGGLKPHDHLFSNLTIRDELIVTHEPLLSDVGSVWEEDEWEWLVERNPLSWRVLTTESSSEWSFYQRLTVWLLYLSEHVQMFVKTSRTRDWKYQEILNQRDRVKCSMMIVLLIHNRHFQISRETFQSHCEVYFADIKIPPPLQLDMMPAQSGMIKIGFSCQLEITNLMLELSRETSNINIFISNQPGWYQLGGKIQEDYLHHTVFTAMLFVHDSTTYDSRMPPVWACLREEETSLREMFLRWQTNINN